MWPLNANSVRDTCGFFRHFTLEIHSIRGEVEDIVKVPHPTNPPTQTSRVTFSCAADGRSSIARLTEPFSVFSIVQFLDVPRKCNLVSQTGFSDPLYVSTAKFHAHPCRLGSRCRRITSTRILTCATWPGFVKFDLSVDTFRCDDDSDYSANDNTYVTNASKEHKQEEEQEESSSCGSTVVVVVGAGSGSGGAASGRTTR